MPTKSIDAIKTQIQPAAEWIYRQQQVLVDTVINWSHINSGSRNLEGLEKMIVAVQAFAKGLPAENHVRQLNPSDLVDADGAILQAPNGRALVLEKNTGANRRVLLTGHLDTVFPPDSTFQKTRWLSDSVLNGPGVADMKGGILVMLTALRAFEQTEFARFVDWEVILSPDEETGSIGSAPLLAERAALAHIGLTYEPALPGGDLAGQRKGSGNYAIIIKGRAAHAGREFFEGRNAVVHGAQLAADLAGLTECRPNLTVNVARIEGGGPNNIVPDTAVVRFNVRMESVADGAFFEKRLDEVIDRYNEADGFSVTLTGGINRPPKEITDAGSRLMNLVQSCGGALGMPVQFKATGGCCEGNNLAAAGLANVDSLGVLGGAIHSHDEFLEVESLTSRAHLSLLILCAFAAGYMDEGLI